MTTQTTYQATIKTNTFCLTAYGNGEYDVKYLAQTGEQDLLFEAEDMDMNISEYADYIFQKHAEPVIDEPDYHTEYLENI